MIIIYSFDRDDREKIFFYGEKGAFFDSDDVCVSVGRSVELKSCLECYFLFRVSVWIFFCHYCNTFIFSTELSTNENGRIK